MRWLNRIVLSLLLIGAQSMLSSAWAQNAEVSTKNVKIVYCRPRMIIDQPTPESTCALFYPDKIVSLNTPLGNVSVSPGAIVLINRLASSMVVYDLYQSKTKQVSITTNNHQFFMEPGYMLTLTSKSLSGCEQLGGSCSRIVHNEERELNWLIKI